jgi:hypothetical protein
MGHFGGHDVRGWGHIERAILASLELEGRSPKTRSLAAQIYRVRRVAEVTPIQLRSVRRALDSLQHEGLIDCAGDRSQRRSVRRALDSLQHEGLIDCAGDRSQRRWRRTRLPGDAEREARVAKLLMSAAPHPSISRLTISPRPPTDPRPLGPRSFILVGRGPGLSRVLAVVSTVGQTVPAPGQSCGAARVWGRQRPAPGQANWPVYAGVGLDSRRATGREPRQTVAVFLAFSVPTGPILRGFGDTTLRHVRLGTILRRHDDHIESVRPRHAVLCGYDRE